MRKLIVRLLNDERVRFLIVGGFNTVLGYGIFALLYLLIGKYIGSLLCVYLQYLISVPLAFYLHRRITFRAHKAGHVMVDFARFCVVYVISLAFNTIALPFLDNERVFGLRIHGFHLPALLAQAIVVALATIFTYFGHKLFSFRRGHSKEHPDALIVDENPDDAADADGVPDGSAVDATAVVGSPEPPFGETTR